MYKKIKNYSKLIKLMFTDGKRFIKIYFTIK